MPHSTVEKAGGGVINITITVGQDELKPHLEKTAQKISESINIDGFRKGNAPYDIVKNSVGEMKNT